MLQTRSAAGALANSAAGAQRRRRVDSSRKKLVARAKRGSQALTRRGEWQMFLCELPVGSEDAASRAKQQATVKYICGAPRLQHDMFLLPVAMGTL